MTRPFVVVGANLAGGRAVEALRDAGYGPLVLVGEEPDRPYERPPLSKELLRGETEPDAVFLREAAFYEEHDVELRLGVRVSALDPEGTVTLDDGDTIGFERCLIATGGRVRRLEVPGAGLEGVRYLRTLGDATGLAEELGRTPRVVVVGAGFIGAEVAASARTLGCEVTMIEIAPVPLGRVLGEDLGRAFADLHRDHGVDLRLGEGVERFEGAGRVEAVVGSSGTRYPADLVVVGVGIAPNTELAEGAGIDCDDGIVVDEQCRTSAPRVFAAGDVARWPDTFSGRRIRVEHYQNAQNQGAHAGRAMLGSEEPYRDLPWFWSDQYDLNLQMLGHPDDDAERIVRGSIPDRDATVFWLRGPRMVAAVALNRPRDIGAARRLIQRGIDVDATTLQDAETDLRELVRG